ncbi:ABC transporter ATP-binding protein [Actinokineospora auranticolor]|uniref:Molybdate transport system ATP-binding protein n=1 Tax=Actinokineospora auranticolor TaxID=155976 RepID=A0A2S6GI91_9PSEU|nr:ABC transporter ATP-binding protein [Actinokineospora auranticolor]PPK64876.1 molybdate transport system ATP-binding protein [Actinokineospora auranticolor]
MTLDAHVRTGRGTFEADVPLLVQPGETVALLGPNGAGKTTVLRALAGLLPLRSGHIRLNTTWDEPPSTFVPPERRAVGVVFQDYLLFPHMPVLENVAFGLRARGVNREAARRAARAQLDAVDLTPYADARPRELSGGQAQRVALARALVTHPDLLLLDEPLSALDAGTRPRVRAELGRHLREFPGCAVLVTHDPLDAMVLADRLVVVEGGRITQSGEPAVIARKPATDYVAHLVGLNLLRGQADGTAVALDTGGTLIVAEPAAGPVHAAFPPTAISLHPERPSGSPRNTWEVAVAGMEQHAHTVRLHLDGAPSVVAEVTPAVIAELGLAPGTRVWAALKATEIQTYPRA